MLCVLFYEATEWPSSPIDLSRQHGLLELLPLLAEEAVSRNPKCHGDGDPSIGNLKPHVGIET